MIASGLEASLTKAARDVLGGALVGGRASVPAFHTVAGQHLGRVPPGEGVGVVNVLVSRVVLPERDRDEQKKYEQRAHHRPSVPRVGALLLHCDSQLTAGKHRGRNSVRSTGNNALHDILALIHDKVSFVTGRSMTRHELPWTEPARAAVRTVYQAGDGIRIRQDVVRMEN